MTDYSELVKALRYCTDRNRMDCHECKYEQDFPCRIKLIADAADAIEALQVEIERLKKGNEELRDKQTYIDHYGNKWMTSAKDAPTAAYEHGYMDGWDEARAKIDGPIITPCRGCSDYDGYGGCKSKGGCARAKMEVQDGQE